MILTKLKSSSYTAYLNYHLCQTKNYWWLLWTNLLEIHTTLYYCCFCIFKMPINAKGKCHQQTGGLTAGLKGMHAKRNYSDGCFSKALAVKVSDVGPSAVCELIYFHFHFLCFRRSTTLKNFFGRCRTQL